MENDKHYAFFQNRECEYFPCHKTKDPENFNCLFCYCPLYALGRRCGGNYEYTDSGVKSCAKCLFPHKKENYEKLNARFREIMELVKEEDEKSDEGKRRSV